MCCLLDDLLTLKTCEYFFLHLEIFINESSFKDLLFVLFQDFFIKFSEPHGKKIMEFHYLNWLKYLGQPGESIT